MENEILRDANQPFQPCKPVAEEQVSLGRMPRK